MNLNEEFIQHKEDLDSGKQVEKQQDAHGKMVAICIRDTALGRLRMKSCKRSYKEQSTSSSSSVCNKLKADATEYATAEAGDNTSGCSNYDIVDGAVLESSLIKNKKCNSPMNITSSSKTQQSASDVDIILKDAMRNSSGHQERMIDLQEKNGIQEAM